MSPFRKLIIFFSFAVIICVVSADLSAGPRPSYMTKGATSSSQGKQNTLAVKGAMIAVIGDDNFDLFLAENDLVILDFYADWCPPCKKLMPIFEQTAEEMSGVLSFGKLYVDKAPQAMRKYAVNSIPTLIIFKNGKEIKRRVGGCNEQELKQFIHSVL